MSENTYEAFISMIERTLQEHNASLRNKANCLVIDRIIEDVQNAGATMSALAHLVESDFTALGIPVALARQFVTAAGGRAEHAAPTAPQTIHVNLTSTADEVQRSSLKTLIDSYDPTNPGAVGERLRTWTRGQPFLLFAPDGSLMRDATLEYAQLVIDGAPVDDMPTVGDVTVIPRRVGEPLTAPVVKENPLFPGEPLLMPAEVCRHTRSSWKGVPQAVRVLVRVAVDTGDLCLGGSTEEARRIIDEAATEGALVSFTRRWKRAAMAMAHMLEADKPTLDLNRRTEAPRGRPFGDEGHEQFARKWCTPDAGPAVAPTIDEAAFDWPPHLSGAEHQELCRALLSAFPTRGALAMMVRTMLSKSLDAITGCMDTTTSVFDLVTDAEAQGYIPRLFVGALHAAPNNADLGAIANKRRDPFSSEMTLGTGEFVIGQAAVALIAEAALNTELARSDSRRALFAGIDANFFASLAICSSPAVQVRSDLDAMNRTGELRDGNMPLMQWLTNAAHMRSSCREVAVFNTALRLLRTARQQGRQQTDLAGALGRLLPAQFEGVLFYARVPTQIISGAAAPQAQRAIDVVRWAATNGKTEALEAAIKRASAQ